VLKEAGPAVRDLIEHDRLSGVLCGIAQQFFSPSADGCDGGISTAFDAGIAFWGEGEASGVAGTSLSSVLELANRTIPGSSSGVGEVVSRRDGTRAKCPLL